MTGMQINEGFYALRTIEEIIICSKEDDTALLDASSNFYKIIPHVFGQNPPQVISTLDKVKRERNMIETLSCMRLAANSSSDASVDIIDQFYRSLECHFEPLDHTSDKFKVLAKCLLETHGPTHIFYTLELVDAFSIDKNSQESAFQNFGNKKLLWHGTRMSNWISIFKTCLRIELPEGIDTGNLFGDALYFADVSSKSANYCYATTEENEALLLLCEVSLGESVSVKSGIDLSVLGEGYSVFCQGKIKPSRFELTALSSDVYVPCGPLCESNIENLSLDYNEYIVYNAKQVQMKYLLRIKFHFK